MPNFTGAKASYLRITEQARARAMAIYISLKSVRLDCVLSMQLHAMENQHGRTSRRSVALVSPH